MTDFRRRASQYGVFMFALLAQGSARAEPMSGLGVVLSAMFGAFSVFWCIVTGIVFWLMRKEPRPTRIQTTAFVFFAPFILIALFALFAAGNQPRNSAGAIHIQRASKPVTVAGATFPAGSVVKYRGETATDYGLISASTDETVLLGALRIKQLRISELDRDRLEVMLAAPQEIDGWRCLARSEFVSLRRVGEQLALQSCRLDAVTIDNITWPAGSELFNRGPGNWRIERGNDRAAMYECKGTVDVFGLPLHSAVAEIDGNRRMSSLEGTTCLRNLSLGGFAILPYAQVQSKPDGTLLILNSRKGANALSCLQVDKGEVKECDASMRPAEFRLGTRP